jgi:hypothetical protein
MANLSKTKRTPDAEAEETLEIPDVFDLRPLASQRITLHIRQVRSAVFYYVPDKDEVDEKNDENGETSCHVP